MEFYFNEYNIDLGEQQYDTTKFKMESNSSYVEKFVKRYTSSKNYREVLLPLKLQCLFNIKEALDGDYKTYFEPLAGLGISAKIFDRGDSYLNDLSMDCITVLKNNFNKDIVTNINIFEYDFSNTDYDFCFADFNNLTLKRYQTLYKPLIDEIFENTQRYILLNDCSVFYLKYGKTSYEVYSKLFGENITNLDGYYFALKTYMENIYPQWNMTQVEAFKDTSFLLFAKNNNSDDFVVNINTKENLNIKTYIQ